MTAVHRIKGVWMLVAVGANVVTGVFAYATGFLFNYFMNDIPRAENHFTFAGFGLIAAAAATLVVGGVSGAARRRDRVVGLAASVGLMMHGIFLALFFWVGAEDFGDESSYFPGAMSAADLRHLAIACVLVAVAAAAAALWLVMASPQLSGSSLKAQQS